HGARISLYVAIASIAASMTLGGALGLTAGYMGGASDNAINRVLDVFFSIPALLLAVGIAAMRGPGVNSAVLAIAIVYTPIFARVMRGPVLAERAKDYVEAVPALGANRVAAALKHLLPTVIPPFVQQGTVVLPQANLTRRDFLTTTGLALGALGVGGRVAHAQGPTKGGSTLITAQTTEATGLDPQLVPALSRSRRSPLTYNQLVRFEPDMTPVPELA